MKKSILLIAFLIFTITTLNAQENDRELIMSGKWYTESIQVGNGRYDIPKEHIKDIWMEFNEDGVCKTYSFDKKEHGTWTYNPEKRTVKIILKDHILNQRIISINSNRLIVASSQGGEEIIVSMKKNI